MTRDLRKTLPRIGRVLRRLGHFARVSVTDPRAAASGLRRRAKGLGSKVRDAVTGPRDRSYFITIPCLEVGPDVDWLLLELPPRYMPFMPNGLGYVCNILRKAGVSFQAIDANIIMYHRYHARRLREAPNPIVAPSGYAVPRDPWDNTSIGEWEKAELVDFFWPDLEELLGRIAERPPRVLGISLNGGNRAVARRFVGTVRERLPGLPVVVGGYDCVYPEVGPRLFGDYDHMVIAEAELTLGPLAEALGRGERPGDLPGIVSRYDSPDRAWEAPPLLQDLDSIGFPKYEWMDNAVYQTYDRKHFVPITASRGCNWGRCRFCAECFPFRRRSPGNVVDEIQYMVKRGFRTFHFNESAANGDPKALYDICSRILNRKLRVQLMGQLRIGRRNTKEYFRHLERAGFRHIRFGVDGWSDRALRLQRKGYDMETVYRNLRDCSAAGIRATVNVVLGVPGETEADVDDAIRNIIRCKDHFDIVESLNTLILAHGSEYFTNPERYGIRFRGDRDRIYEEHFSQIPPDLWYSTSPYIDQDVRLERLDRLCHSLDEGGVGVGTFAAGVVDTLRKERSRTSV
jgi:radical SAM superfamily enzyme YgiQ (UPF0313 family)